MLNNCAGGVTPWGTWLTCEENFNGYFWGKAAAEAMPRSASTASATACPASGTPGASSTTASTSTKEPNEPNRFGWVVEIDPFDPASTPVKRTALGRFKHEGAGNIVNKDGRFVVYQGDDERFDYVYKFVTDGKVDPEQPRRQQGPARRRHALRREASTPTAPATGCRWCMARAR